MVSGFDFKDELRSDDNLHIVIPCLFETSTYNGYVRVISCLIMFKRVPTDICIGQILVQTSWIVQGGETMYQNIKTSKGPITTT